MLLYFKDYLLINICESKDYKNYHKLITDIKSTTIEKYFKQASLDIIYDNRNLINSSYIIYKHNYLSNSTFEIIGFIQLKQKKSHKLIVNFVLLDNLLYKIFTEDILQLMYDKFYFIKSFCFNPLSYFSNDLLQTTLNKYFHNNKIYVKNVYFHEKRRQDLIMENNIILIKYGELTTKKNNRKMFIITLKNNIEAKLKNYTYKLTYDHTRMFIEVIDQKEMPSIIEDLKTVFGIHGIVICTKVNTNVEDIKIEVLKAVTPNTSFKVKTKRGDKNFKYTSPELNVLLGTHILNNIPNVKVDVHNPDTTVEVEIREQYAYVYSKTIKGAGGYPVSTLGKGLLMISGGIDSPVAGYLAMKRGVNIECIYFTSPPHTSINADNKVKELVQILSNYQSTIKLHIVPFTKIQETIYKKCDNDYLITLMRRMMYRISERLAKRNKLKILINGESLGQVASQTLSSISVINEVINTPVIRPVACLDKLEIISISKDINTYETSILPYEDCCTVFIPKHPVINPNKFKCIQSEELFNVEELIDDVMNNIETITINHINTTNSLL